MAPPSPAPLPPWVTTLEQTLSDAIGRAGLGTVMESSSGALQLSVQRPGTALHPFQIFIRPKRLSAYSESYSSTGKFLLSYSVRDCRPSSSSEHRLAARLTDVVRTVLLQMEPLIAESEILSHFSPAPQGLINDEVLAGQEVETGTEFILRISFACNQDCPFCFVRLTDKPVKLDAIEKRLRLLSSSMGPCAVLTISGGEPAADPRLLRILEGARAMGFRKFRIQTNAVHLSRPALAEKLVSLGADEFFVSFHSHLPRIYDRITGSRKQWPAALAGIRRLLAAEGSQIVFNIVVNRLNSRFLPAHISFLARLAHSNGRSVGVFFSMFNDIGHKKAPSLAVDLGEVKPFLERAVERARKAGLKVSRFAGDCSLPVCLLKDTEHYASETVFSNVDVAYADAPGEQEVRRGRMKNPSCRDCVYNARCRGVPSEYARRFGLGSIQPVRRFEL